MSSVEVRPSIYQVPGRWTFRRGKKILEVNGTPKQVIDALEDFAAKSNVAHYLVAESYLAETTYTNYLGGKVEVSTHPRKKVPGYRLRPEVLVGTPYEELIPLVPTLDSRQRYPPSSKVFAALLDSAKPKVLIIGQDPYHQPGQAIGLAFLVGPEVKPPPSLVNIRLELARDLGPGGGSPAGVVLLNTSLTVLPSTPGSDVQAWKPFTLAAVRMVAARVKVIMAWGSPAKSIAEAALAGSPTRPRIVSATHPSPLSAHRPSGSSPAFIGSGCFSQANRILEEAGEEGVDWLAVFGR